MFTMGVYGEILYPLSDLNEIWHQSSPYPSNDRGEFELDLKGLKLTKSQYPQISSHTVLVPTIKLTNNNIADIFDSTRT